MRAGGGVVVQGGVQVVRRQRPAQPLRQQRTDQHADGRHAQTKELRRNRAGLAQEGFDQQPGEDAAENRRQGALGGGAFPVGAEKERHEGAGQGDLVGRLDHVEDGQPGIERVGEHHAGKAENGQAHDEQELPVVQLRQETAQDVFGKGHRGREQGGGRTAHDRREHRAEENRLRENRRAFHDQGGQDALRIAVDQGAELRRIDQGGGVSNEHRHEGEAEIKRRAQHRTPDGDARAPGRGDALKNVLLRDGAQHHGDAGADERQPGLRIGLRKKGKFAGGARVFDDWQDAAGLVADQPGDEQKAAHDHAHLHEIENRHRQHAAEGGVGEHDGGAEHHAGRFAQGAAGDDVEQEAERLDLRRHPAQVGDDDAQRHQDFDAAAVAQAVKVAQGQDVEAVKARGEKEAGDDQAQAGAERIGDHAAQTLAHEGGRNAEHRFGPEPGGEHRGHDHRHGQMPAGHREILGGMHARRGKKADADRKEQIQDHEPDQHDAFSPVFAAVPEKSADYKVHAPVPGGNPAPAVRGRVFQSAARQRYLLSRYSARPWRAPSRPRPDCLMPPNGATALEIRPVLMPTMPYSSASPTRMQRPMSRL